MLIGIKMTAQQKRRTKHFYLLLLVVLFTTSCSTSSSRYVSDAEYQQVLKEIPENWGIGLVRSAIKNEDKKNPYPPYRVELYENHDKLYKDRAFILVGKGFVTYEKPPQEFADNPLEFFSTFALKVYTQTDVPGKDHRDLWASNLTKLSKPAPIHHTAYDYLAVFPGKYTIERFQISTIAEVIDHDNKTHEWSNTNWFCINPRLQFTVEPGDIIVLGKYRWDEIIGLRWEFDDITNTLGLEEEEKWLHNEMLKIIYQNTNKAPRFIDMRGTSFSQCDSWFNKHAYGDLYNRVDSSSPLVDAKFLSQLPAGLDSSLINDRVEELEKSDADLSSSFHPLTIKTNPANARVRIMNIGPKYKDGILLAPGKYDIEVSKSGYKTYREDVFIDDEPVIETVILKPLR